MNSPELVFLHIPKTAGTSQYNLFTQHYGRDNVFWIGVDCQPNIFRYPGAQVGKRLLVGGHKPLSFYPRAIDPLYCAIVRDPVARAISLFGYYTRPEFAMAEHERKTRAEILQRLRRKGMDPDSMLGSIRNCGAFRRKISNYQCRYLSRGRANFAGVLKTLQPLDCIIGTVDTFARFQGVLGELMGWSHKESGRLNRSKDNYAEAYLEDKELVALVQELSDEDQKLVNWVSGEHDGLWQNFTDHGQRVARLRMIPRATVPPVPPQRSWENAGELWPPARPEQLPGPLGRIMVAEPCRLLYMPVAGVLDQHLQLLMLQLSSIDHKEAVLQLGLGRVVEHFATRLLLRDRSRSELRAIATSKAYFKFAFVYEPVARLVDVYAQHFVLMRDSLPQRPGLSALVADVQGLAVPDCKLGISFRQFVSAIVEPGEKHKHPLWQPQSRSLLDPASYDRIYRVDQLPELQRDLASLRGLSIDLGAARSAVPDCCEIAPPGPQQLARYADTASSELPPDPSEWREQLVDEAIYKLLQEFYSSDFSLYNRIAAKDLESVAP